MNYKKLFLITTSSLTFVSHLSTAVVPYYAIRPQGAYTSRNLAGLYPLLTQPQESLLNGAIAITADYSTSMSPKNINKHLFGSCKCPSINISGSRVDNRGQKDWLADNFYLPNDFKSTLSFSPTVDTFLLDFNFVLDLSQWIRGAYVDIHMPVAQTRFDLNMHESVEQRGVNPQPEGMIAPGEINRGQLLEDFTAYAQGDLVQPIAQMVADTPFLTIMQQLKRAKMSPTCKKDTGIADIRINFGWNWKQDDYHLGFALQAIAPGGNRPRGMYLFEPILGNAHSWEFGGNINAHYDIWKNQAETKAFTLYAYTNFTHVFSSTQWRTFDLINSPFSRYMLAEKMNTPITDNLRGDGIIPSAQFKQEVAPVANLTNLKVGVSAAIHADLVLTAQVRCNEFTFDIGYNYWARSTDNIKTLGLNELDNNKTWALKGDAQLYGFADTATINQAPPSFFFAPTCQTTDITDMPAFGNSTASFFAISAPTPTEPIDIISPAGELQAVACTPLNSNAMVALNQGQPVPLSATQSKATIYHGTNLPASGAPEQIVFDNARQNLGIDSPHLATAGGSDTEPSTPLLTTTNPATQQRINTSIQPEFLSMKSLDIEGAKTRGMSSSIFAHIHYNGTERSGFTPSVGLGGQVEYAHNGWCSKKACRGFNTALDQWQIWLKLCFTFA